MKKICCHICLLAIGGLLGAVLAPSLWFRVSQHERECFHMPLVAFHKEYALYASSDGSFVLFRGKHPVVSELRWSDLPERSFYSPYGDPYINDIICNIVIVESVGKINEASYSLGLCENATPRYVYHDTNGDGFLDSLLVIEEGKPVAVWNFALHNDGYHATLRQLITD